jgi:pimeloyl-ACP methyl ester carboxylesterase
VVVSRFVMMDGVRLHYLTVGELDAPAVLLLHGGGIDSAQVSWRHLIPELAASHHVLALDLPGYGRSSPPPYNTAYTTAYLVRTALGFLDALEVAVVSLVGLSMGGATALGLTFAAPERVRRLVLVDSYGLQDRAPFHPLSVLALHLPGFVQRQAWGLVRGNPLVMRLGLSAIYRNPLRLTRGTLSDAHESIRLELFYEWLRSEVRPLGTRTNYSTQLDKLTQPVLVVHGQHDPSIPLHWAQRAVKRLAHGELVVIAGAGHWPNREQPTAFNAAVRAFLCKPENPPREG